MMGWAYQHPISKRSGSYPNPVENILHIEFRCHPVKFQY